MKNKTVFYCTACGNETGKWSGKCMACGAWNTLVEAPVTTKSKESRGHRISAGRIEAKPLNQIDGETGELRFSTGISEFDRVLGGGAVRGSLVLVGGAPGIGKSTLLLQFCGKISAAEKVLYVTGEESCHQLKMRAERLKVCSSNIFVLAETDMEEILAAAETMNPDVVIIDSIQTTYASELTGTPGSLSQIKECTMALMQVAKSKGFTVFVVGHVNKDGAIAGPKVLEHMVDCVLYFEGDRGLSYRMLRAAKNRFGSTNEIGVFEMTDHGLESIENPSEMMLSGRPERASGTCVTCVMEGTRPILAEVQALVAPTSFSAARRNSNGIEHNRAMLLIAVLEKRGGMPVGGCDTYINVIGGLDLDEPVADLAVILALASSYRDRAIGSDVAAVGEIGLTGEIRSVTALDQRLKEIARLGFSKCVVPAHIRGEIKAPAGLTLIPVRTVAEAIAAVLA
jgi:DNA repair protein RadA/Sms